MPRSQTPVVSRPLAMTRAGLLPSSRGMLSALGPVARTYLLSTIIHFSGFNTAACVLALPLLRTPPLSGRTSVRLPTGWLAFGRVGLELPLTHWVTLTCFKRCLLYPHVPRLARREPRLVRWTHIASSGWRNQQILQQRTGTPTALSNRTSDPNVPPDRVVLPKEAHLDFIFHAARSNTLEPLDTLRFDERDKLAISGKAS